MPYLASPEWLVLLPALVFVVWYWQRPRLTHPLRFAALALLIIVLCEPELPGGGKGIDALVPVDRSSSAASWMEPRRKGGSDLARAVTRRV